MKSIMPNAVLATRKNKSVITSALHKIQDLTPVAQTPLKRRLITKYDSYRRAYLMSVEEKDNIIDWVVKACSGGTRQGLAGNIVGVSKTIAC
jgi:hypothetical protein